MIFFGHLLRAEAFLANFAVSFQNHMPNIWLDEVTVVILGTRVNLHQPTS